MDYDVTATVDLGNVGLAEGTGQRDSNRKAHLRT